MIFRQLFDSQSSTYSYFLGDESSREAILIDPVFDQVRREIALLEELDLRLVATLETHVHADHVTGAWLLKQALGSKVALSAASGATGADLYLSHGDAVSFGVRSLECRATPGHTAGCMTYVLDNKRAAFTGDALLIRGCGRTDFQQGSASSLYRSVHEQIFSLPPGCLIYPGHDYAGSTVSSVGEEKSHNPRLRHGIGEPDFRGYMENLGLPHPKLMDIAVPANLKCGKPDAIASTAQAWGPVNTNYAGIPEIAPQWVEENLAHLYVLDVREPAEFNDIFSHIRGATLIPLPELKSRIAEIDRDKPVVVVCRSGARSARATQLLEQAGFDRVANISGGMLRWHALHLAVE